MPIQTIKSDCLWNFHLVFPDKCWPQVAKAMENGNIYQNKKAWLTEDLAYEKDRKERVFSYQQALCYF